MTLDKRTMNESRVDVYPIKTDEVIFPASHITFHGCTIPPNQKLLFAVKMPSSKHILPNGGVFHGDESHGKKNCC